MKKFPFHYRAILLTGLVLMLAACAQDALPRTSRTPTTMLTPTSPPLGAVPQDCPSGPTPQKFSDQFGPAIGGSPVWATSFDGPHATLHLTPLADYTRYGWQ